MWCFICELFAQNDFQKKTNMHSKNCVSFMLVKCIWQYVQDEPVIILVLVWCKLIHFSRMYGVWPKTIPTFSFQWPWPLNSKLLHHSLVKGVTSLWTFYSTSLLSEWKACHRQTDIETGLHFHYRPAVASLHTSSHTDVLLPESLPVALSSNTDTWHIVTDRQTETSMFSQSMLHSLFLWTSALQI